MITNIDDNVKRLEDRLRELGLRDNTIFIFMTDNGSTFGPTYYNAGMRGGKVTLGQLDAPQVDWPSVLAAFEDALGHEQKVTSRINDLMSLALDEKDHASAMFLQWFVTEQVEEEENDNDMIAQLKLIDGNPQGLLMLDRELAGRKLEEAEA